MSESEMARLRHELEHSKNTIKHIMEAYARLLTDLGESDLKLKEALEKIKTLEVVLSEVTK